MFPDFLCIGAQKSGTSWLTSNIRLHPDIWTTPVKGIHFFNDLPPLPMITRVFNRKQRNNKWRHLLIGQLGRAVKAPHTLEVRWLLRFFLLQRSESWYASLFTPGEGQIAGEITPAYARLDEDTVGRVHSLMPNAKIIYLLRDPRSHRANVVASRNALPEKGPPEPDRCQTGGYPRFHVP